MRRRPSRPEGPSLTADEVYKRLLARYALPEWGLFRQVCEAGEGGARYADAIAMNLFRSRGYEVEGFEIKVSRSDWLREKRDPAKADALARFTDRWWIVAGHPDLVAADELPPTWGLLVPRGDGLFTKVAAPKLAPDPLSVGFVATILRRAQVEEENRFSWDAQIQKAVRAEQERLHAEHEKELAKAVAPLHALEEALGMEVGRIDWGPHKPQDVGRAVRLLLAGEAQVEQVRAQLEWKRRSLVRLLASLDEMLGPAEATGPEVGNGATGTVGGPQVQAGGP